MLEGKGDKGQWNTVKRCNDELLSQAKVDGLDTKKTTLPKFGTSKLCAYGAFEGKMPPDQVRGRLSILPPRMAALQKVLDSRLRPESPRAGGNDELTARS